MAFGRKGISRTPAHPPHWMRQLEEKYQRLHAKIASQTDRYTCRRQGGSTGNNFHTPRWALDTQTISSTKERGKAGVGNLDSRPGYRHPEDCIKSRSGDSACEETNGASHFTVSDSGTKTKGLKDILGNKETATCAEDLESCFLDSELFAASQLEVSQNFSATITGSPCLVLAEEDCERQCEGSSRVSSICLLPGIRRHSVLLEAEERDDEVESNVVFREDYSPKVSVHNCVDADDVEDNLAGNQAQILDMEVSEYRSPKGDNLQMKKSESRNSHKTTKSCPATLNADNTREIIGSQVVTGSWDDVFNSRNLEFPFSRALSHRSRPKVFARMSLEARHAIDETLREMKAEEEQQQMNDGMTQPSILQQMNDDMTQPSILQQMNDGMTQPSILQQMNDGMTQPSLLPTDNQSVNADKFIIMNSPIAVTSPYGLNKTLPESYSYDDSLAENNNNYLRKNLNATYPADNFRTKTDALGGRTHRKLPQLDFGAVPPSGFPNPHQRLPDIGQPYEPGHFRENTFEITPVDFDIRFHQIIPYSPGDSPPPDVRQQSIEKCQHWLVRHTPRH